MKFLVLILGIFLFLALPNYAQESAGTPVRTPEQEAAIQTERMQQELNLNKEQAQLIYEINLRHARERKVATSRAQAVERVRVKDNEIQQVLNREQYQRLQEMRYERPTPVNTSGNRTINTEPRTRPTNPSTGSAPALRANPRSDNPNVRRIEPRNTTPQQATREASPDNRSQQNTDRRAVPVIPRQSEAPVRAVPPANTPSRSTPPASNPQPRQSTESSRGSSSENSSGSQRR